MRICAYCSMHDVLHRHSVTTGGQHSVLSLCVVLSTVRFHASCTCILWREFPFISVGIICPWLPQSGEGSLHKLPSSLRVASADADAHLGEHLHPGAEQGLAKFSGCLAGRWYGYMLGGGGKWLVHPFVDGDMYDQSFLGLSLVSKQRTTERRRVDQMEITLFQGIT